MPYGEPFSDEQREVRHLAKYGTLENFPEGRRGAGAFWLEDEEKKKWIYGIGGALVGAIIGYLISKR